MKIQITKKCKIQQKVCTFPTERHVTNHIHHDLHVFAIPKSNMQCLFKYTENHILTFSSSVVKSPENNKEKVFSTALCSQFGLNAWFPPHQLSHLLQSLNSVFSATSWEANSICSHRVDAQSKQYYIQTAGGPELSQ